MAPSSLNAADAIHSSLAITNAVLQPEWLQDSSKIAANGWVHETRIFGM